MWTLVSVPRTRMGFCQTVTLPFLWHVRRCCKWTKVKETLNTFLAFKMIVSKWFLGFTGQPGSTEVASCACLPAWYLLFLVFFLASDNIHWSLLCPCHCKGTRGRGGQRRRLGEWTGLFRQPKSCSHTPGQVSALWHGCHSPRYNSNNGSTSAHLKPPVQYQCYTLIPKHTLSLFLWILFCHLCSIECSTGEQLNSVALNGPCLT